LRPWNCSGQFEVQAGPVCSIEKLLDGVVQLQTPIGPRYLMPTSFSQRVVSVVDVPQLFRTASGCAELAAETPD